MKKCMLNYIIIVMLIGTAYNMQIVFAASEQQKSSESKGADMQIDTILSKVKELGDEYNKITEKQLLKEKGLISSKKEGNSHTIQIFDKNKKERKKFVFTKNSIKSVSCRNNKKDGFDIFYYSNGVIGNYVEYKNGKLNGLFVEFHENGSLQHLGECQNGKFIGHARWWDKSGKLVESVEYQQPQDFKINKVAPKTTDN